MRCKGITWLLYSGHTKEALIVYFEKFSKALFSSIVVEFVSL